MFKNLRIAVLLLILFIVAGDTYLTKFRAVSWEDSLWVGIYPVNANGAPAIDRYIATLTDRQFEDISEFFQEEAEGYGISLQQPFTIRLAHPVTEQPPPPPVERSVFAVMWWSLKLRYWAYQHDNSDFSPHIRVFVIYHDYEKQKALDHSLGIEKGMIGVVHAFAHRELEGKNNLVIAHELLHTLGATDKYTVETGVPLYPDGYAEPDASPLHPQHYAELMAGKIPVTEYEYVMPRSLRSVVIGSKTAQEINWLVP